MVLQVIYVVRHGFRSNWSTDPKTGDIKDSFPCPTGIKSDPALSSHGVSQSRELAKHIITLQPRPDVVYSSPFYRCLQTIQPSVEALWPQVDSVKHAKDEGKVRIENGLGEWYGLARFDHPVPASLEVLVTHFPEMLSNSHSKAIFIPSSKGESVLDLHNRAAYTLLKLISTLDADPVGPQSLLICTHAALMIVIGRVLTGLMPEDPNEDDFQCYTCSLSKFQRRATNGEIAGSVEVKEWDRKEPVVVPESNWKGNGVAGGWDCIINGQTDFLSSGAERGWTFADELISENHPLANNPRRNRASFGEKERTAARRQAEEVLRN